jgi:hypothetical protein
VQYPDSWYGYADTRRIQDGYELERTLQSPWTSRWARQRQLTWRRARARCLDTPGEPSLSLVSRTCADTHRDASNEHSNASTTFSSNENDSLTTVSLNAHNSFSSNEHDSLTMILSNEHDSLTMISSNEHDSLTTISSNEHGSTTTISSNEADVSTTISSNESDESTTSPLNECSVKIRCAIDVPRWSNLVSGREPSGGWDAPGGAGWWEHH